MYMQVTLACIYVILSTLGGETIANTADDKDAVEEGRSLGGGVGFALLPLFMLGVRKCKIYDHSNYDQCRCYFHLLDMLYRWLKNQKDGSGLTVNINAGDGYEFNARINLKHRNDQSFYEDQEYQGPEYYPAYPYKKNEDCPA